LDELVDVDEATGDFSDLKLATEEEKVRINNRF
jgi:hypothetical protein